MIRIRVSCLSSLFFSNDLNSKENLQQGENIWDTEREHSKICSLTLFLLVIWEWILLLVLSRFRSVWTLKSLVVFIFKYIFFLLSVFFFLVCLNIMGLWWVYKRYDCRIIAVHLFQVCKFNWINYAESL